MTGPNDVLSAMVIERVAVFLHPHGCSFRNAEESSRELKPFAGCPMCASLLGP